MSTETKQAAESIKRASETLEKNMKKLATELDEREKKKLEEELTKTLENKLRETPEGRKCIEHPNYQNLSRSTIPEFNRAAEAQRAPYIREFSGSWKKYMELPYILSLATKPGSMCLTFFSYDYIATVKENQHNRVSIELHCDQIGFTVDENGIEAVFPIKWADDVPHDEFHPRSYKATYKTLEEFIDAASPKVESSLVYPDGYFQCRAPLATLKGTLTEKGITLIDYAKSEYNKLSEQIEYCPKHSLPIKLIFEKRRFQYYKKDSLEETATEKSQDATSSTTASIEKIQAEKQSEMTKEIEKQREKEKEKEKDRKRDEVEIKERENKHRVEQQQQKPMPPLTLGGSGRVSHERSFPRGVLPELSEGMSEEEQLQLAISMSMSRDMGQEQPDQPQSGQQRKRAAEIHAAMEALELERVLAASQIDYTVQAPSIAAPGEDEILLQEEFSMLAAAGAHDHTFSEASFAEFVSGSSSAAAESGNGQDQVARIDAVNAFYELVAMTKSIAETESGLLSHSIPAVLSHSSPALSFSDPALVASSPAASASASASATATEGAAAQSAASGLAAANAASKNT